ncbi:hypothetical protein HYALB_00000195 [Hymenoscyphus albidus]|uniref:Thiol methyltransferase n=1 Tax=Hymenoscyphus albidus TaxID=595503 RepID=A0A9N9Q9J9_9HELO|nr:hypothetical protein HYALB_00000195 [Hymenoscyphus albidus]
MSTPDQPTDAREKLSAHFQGDSSLHNQKWDALWKEGFLPWDKGFPSPALVDLLADRKDLFGSVTEGKKRKALVPGCGKGYDVLLFSAYGYDAYGLDVSETALEAAKETERRMEGDETYEIKGVEKGSVNWIVGDFFTNDFWKDVEGEGTFDLIYDYTFLSALPPSLRAGWSARFKELLAPQGKIICVEFPTYKPHSTGGPPWALPPKVYLGHLSRPGQELPYDEETGLLESELKEPGKDRLERLEHFPPKRTHQIGYNADGKVTDWVSVWAHPNAL